VSSIVYGRPVSIPYNGHTANNNDLPSLVDDKFTALGESQPVDIPSSNAFFANVVKLYRVMDEILESLRNPSAINTPALGAHFSQSEAGHHQPRTPCAMSQLTAILQLDALLLKWHDDLPLYLKFSLDGPDDVTSLTFILQRQKVILKTRFLGMRILLHRQSVLFLLQSPDTRKWPQNPSWRSPPSFSGPCGSILHADKSVGSVESGYSHLFEAQLARISAEVCVQMAQLQIEVISSSRPLRLSGAWWWDFHCKQRISGLDSLSSFVTNL
jgi:hypothetical protein